MTLSLMVLGVLLLLGWGALHFVVERLVFHLTRRPAIPTILEGELARWRQGLAPGPQPGLGWLRPLLSEAGGDTTSLRRLCHAEKRQMLLGQAFLPMAADVATSLGLLGTALALKDAAGSAHVLTVLGEGMHKMIAGLLIAIPAFSVHVLCGRRAAHLAAQAEEVLRALASCEPGGPGLDGKPAPLPVAPRAPVPVRKKLRPSPLPPTRRPGPTDWLG